jgi:hypothetical protein
MPSSVSAQVEKWNRKLHYYLGLYLLFILWLFLLTGLMLNHGQWFADANKRTETRYERPVDPLAGNDDLARARDAAQQLGLTGEIELPAIAQLPGHLDFTVARPSDANQVRVDLPRHRASLQHFENHPLAAFRILHTFSGARANVPTAQRDWVVTTVWVMAMDALAIGLIVMVCGSYYMWYRLKRTHNLGWLVLAAGFATCAGFFGALLSR